MSAYLRPGPVTVTVYIKGEAVSLSRDEARQLKKDATEAVRLHRIADKHRAAMWSEVWS